MAHAYRHRRSPPAEVSRVRTGAMEHVGSRGSGGRMNLILDDIVRLKTGCAESRGSAYLVYREQFTEPKCGRSGKVKPLGRTRLPQKMWRTEVGTRHAALAGRRDFARRPEFIPSASTMRADPAGAMSP
eukprot:2246531-Prymnesium_polylepis.1